MASWADKMHWPWLFVIKRSLLAFALPENGFAGMAATLPLTLHRPGSLKATEPIVPYARYEKDNSGTPTAWRPDRST